MEPTEVIIAVRVPVAMNSELEKLAQETQRTKSSLIREAILSLIGMMRNAPRKT